jgi:autotransporter-associated beta strand protein
MSIAPDQAPRLFVSQNFTAAGQGPRRRLISSFLASCLVLLCSAQWAWCDFRYWIDVAGDHLWSTPSNWSPQVAPVGGDILVFGDPTHDFGASGGFTIDDIPNLMLDGVELGDDTDGFTIESTAGTLYTRYMVLYHANDGIGLTVDCPVANLDLIQNLNDGSTEIEFNGPVQFPYGGQIETMGGSPGYLSPNVLQITFNDSVTCTNDLTVFAAGDNSSDGQISYITFNNLAVYGNVDAVTDGNPSCSIGFTGSQDNLIQGYLNLDCDQGKILFFMASNTVAASNIIVLDGDTANIVLDAPGNIGTGSTLTIAGNSEVNLSGYDALMGTLVLEHLAGDSGVPYFDTGDTVPEFGAGSQIIVADDNSAGNPQIFGSVRLDGTQIEVSGTGASILDIGAFPELGQSMQGSGFNKTGTGTLVLNGSAHFTGAVTVSGGALQPNGAAALNITGPEGALHLNGGTLWAQDLDIANVPLYVDGPFSEVMAFTPCTWGGPVTLSSTLVIAPINLTGTNAAINFSGPISGTGGLYLQNEFFGAGAVELSGPEGNTFTGPITDNCQLLEFNKPANVPAFSGPLIAGGPGGVELGEVRWLNTGQGVRPDLTVYSNCVVNLNNFNQDLAAITFNGGEIETGNGLLTFYQQVTVNPTGVTATINGSVDMAEFGAAIFNVGAGGVDPDLLIQAAITGTSAQVTKTGPGILRLSGANNFAALTEVQQGVLELGNTSALGIPSTTVIVDAGATLEMEPGITLENAIIMSGGLAVPAGQSVVMTGTITLQNPTTINVAGDLLINATINGTGGLTKTGGGALSLGGSAPNLYTGDTQVSGGTLLLGKPNDIYAVPGNLIIGTSGFRSTPSTVLQAGNSSIGGSVTVNAGSLWQLDDGVIHLFNSSNLNGNWPLTLVNGGGVQTGTGQLWLPGGNDIEVIPGNFGSSTIAGTLVLYPGPNNFSIGERTFAIAGPACRITANIGEAPDFGAGTPAQLNKSWLGTLVLSGTNNYAGNTIVSNGTLEIDGVQPQSLVQVFAATLQGNGTLGPLELDDPNAVVAPSGIPSTLACSNFNEGATPDGTLQIYLAGNQPGTGYSQVVASGAVSLHHLDLNASLLFYSSYGDQFTILKNNGGAPSRDTFHDLPEGSIFPISGEMFQITYAGGSGSDVVLTHLSSTNQANVANWTNGSGGDWNHGANWNTGAVPNGGYAVVTVGTSCVISNNANVSPSQMLFNSPRATITGSGNFSISGILNWQAGAFNGSGSINANGGLHLDPGSSSLSLAGESLINSGDATWSASTALTLSGGAVLSNAASGTFDCASDGTIQNGPGTNLLANAGLLRKINSTGITTFFVPLDNSGTVQVQTGTLNLAGGGSSSGNYQISSGALLTFNSTIVAILPGGLITGAGDFQVVSGTVNLFGSVNTLGAHTFTGGIVNVGDNYNPANNDVSIDASTVNFDGTNPVTAASLTVGGYGFLGGSNLLTVSGPLTWNGSFTITGSNSVIADGGLVISQGGTLLGRTLLNMDSGVWTNNGIGTLEFGGGAIFSNAPGATFDCVGNSIIEQTAGGGTIANAGLFRIMGPPATTTIDVPFNNSGTLEVQSGLLSLSGGGMNTGVINVFSNATLSLGGGFSLAPGASITGAGQLLVPFSTSAANLAGTINLTGSNMFSGGIANLTGNYICSNIALTIEAGTANFNTSNVISPSTLTVGGYGSLGGSNLVTVSGPMTWNSGFTITGSNSVIANGGLTIGPGSVTLDGRTLVNMAFGLWTNYGGTGMLQLIDGAVLSNAPEATFDCVGNGTIEASTGGGWVANAGLFQTVGEPATNLIQAPFSNNAVVEVQSGMLSLGEGGSSIAPSNSIAEIDVFSNATIDFRGGTFLLDPGAIMDGPGNLSVSGGTANLAGEVYLLGSHSFTGGVANLTGFYNCVSNALLISGGTANFNGSGVIAPASLVLGIYGTLAGSNFVTVNGPMTWGGASTITGANSVTANAGLTIGPGNVSISGRALVNTGPALWTNNGPGDILLYDGALLSNAPSGTFDCLGNGVIDFSAGGGVLANAGLFRIIGAGAATTIDIPFTNNGTVEVDSGTLSFSAPPYTQTAGLTFLDGGNISNSTPLQILGGELTGSGSISGSLTNAGFLHPGSPFGQMTIGGAYTQTAAGTLDITLAGPIPGAGFNSLIVGNTAQLGGVLAVSFTNSFEPPIGSRFQILSCAMCGGAFSALSAPSGISVNYSSNAVFLVVTGAVLTPALLQAPQLSGGNLSFNFLTASNQSYTIQENTDVATTNWFVVTNFTGDGSLFQFAIPLTTRSPQDFFRVHQP